jgi:hypothetical protein
MASCNKNMKNDQTTQPCKMANFFHKTTINLKSIQPILYPRYFFCHTYYCIKNLTFNDSIMEIVWSLFIHIFCTKVIMHWKHVWHINKCVKRIIYDIMNGQTSYHFIYLCVTYVFNAWYLCMKCTNLRMNKLCTIFSMKSSNVNFVMNFFLHITFKFK